MYRLPLPMEGEPAYDFLHFYCKGCYSLIIYSIWVFTQGADGVSRS